MFEFQFPTYVIVKLENKMKKVPMHAYSLPQVLMGVNCKKNALSMFLNQPPHNSAIKTAMEGFSSIISHL